MRTSEEVRHDGRGPSDASGCSLTTRNQLPGIVRGVISGSVMAEVSVAVAGGEFVAAVTRHSVERLGLVEGDEVTVLVKATEVMIARGSSPLEQLSTRNQLVGLRRGDRDRFGHVGGESHGRPLRARRRRDPPQRRAARLAHEGADVVVLIKASGVMLTK
jgi:molybdopterin-binding protein